MQTVILRVADSAFRNTCPNIEFSGRNVMASDESPSKAGVDVAVRVVQRIALKLVIEARRNSLSGHPNDSV